MNTIEITAISLTRDNTEHSPLSNVFGFCKTLNEILTNIKICHLFTNNYNSHKIYGELYDTLSTIFDSLEEEVIGLVKSGTDISFPVYDTPSSSYMVCDGSDYFQMYKRAINSLYSVLTLEDFLNFVDNTPKNGIHNILEEIYSATNKADYLLGMSVKTSPAQVSDNSGSVTQTDIAPDYPTQTFLTPQV